MSTGVRAEFLAADVYRSWRARISKASDSVTIFGPYLDELVLRLIQASPLPPERFTVVTDLSPESGALDYESQLRALLKLTEMGVNVRSLVRLHAKVLLVDDANVTLGSQNFTRYARTSKEATALAVDPSDAPDFLDQLHLWADESDEVSATELRYLLHVLDGAMKVARRATKDLQESFDKAKEELEEQRRKEAEERLRHQAHRSEYQLREDRVFAEVTSVGRREGGYYETLMANQPANLTQWQRTKGRQVTPIELGRLTMHPIMLSDSGRMGFARIGRTRISYIRDRLSRQGSHRLANRPVKITVSFLPTSLRRRNVRFEIDDPISRSKCEIDTSFDGEGVRVVATRPPRGSRRTPAFVDLESACRDHFESHDNLQRFFAHQLQAFRYETLGIDWPNAGTFFTARHYRLELITFYDTPILVATRIW